MGSGFFGWLAFSREKLRFDLFCLSLLCLFSSCLAAQPASEKTEVEKLTRELEKRDAIIQDLLRRVERLERQAGASQSREEKFPAQPSSPHRPSMAVKKQKKTQTQPAAPGTFEVDEELAERALERTLTISGALLLPPWRLDLQPSFSYTRNVQRQTGRLIIDQGTDTESTGEIGIGEIRQNIFNFNLLMRLGLPFDSQLEFSVPYQIIKQKHFMPRGQFGLVRNDDTASTFGDVSIGFAKTLLREKNWWPDLIGRITWDTDTGQRQDKGIAFNSGINELRLSLTALKRQDPLAFVGSIFYSRAFEKKGFHPGDEFGATLGASLAASPDTSLSITFQQLFANEDELRGRNIRGSEQVISSLIFGATTRIGRATFVTLSPGFGLTDDAPDYFVDLTWSVRVR